MHVRADELELYVLGRLNETQASEVVCHVAGCLPCDKRLNDTRRYLSQLSELGKRQSADLIPKEKRKQRRIRTDHAADLKIIQPASSDPLSARILDVSTEGLKVRLLHPLQVGTAVEIRMELTLIFAEVRYCRRVGEAFEAGVRIENIFPRRPPHE